MSGAHDAKNSTNITYGNNFPVQLQYSILRSVNESKAYNTELEVQNTLTHAKELTMQRYEPKMCQIRHSLLHSSYN
jgi:hypothetical protein